MRLRGRLFLFFALVIAVGASTSFVLVRRATESQFRSFVYSGDAEKARVYAGILGDFYAEKKGWEGAQEFLAGIPELLLARLDERIHGAPAAGRSSPPSAFSALLSDRIALADEKGQIVADTSRALLGSVHPAMHLARGAPVMVGFSRVGTVLVGSMVDSSFTGADRAFLGSIAGSLAWALAASTAIALVLGFAFSARVTRPIAALGSALRKVASGDLAMALPVEGRDEVGELSASFNSMAAELRRLEEEKRRIIADSAHELRTPVTLIRLSIEAMLDGVMPADEAGLRGVHEETLRLSRLIDMLRELELIDSGRLELSLEDLDLAEALRGAAALFKAAASEKGLSLAVLAPASPALPDARAPRVRADPLRLGEVLYNLLSNAVKYTPRGGRIELSAEASDGMALVKVEDSGPGIPSAERELVFERFYRMDKSRAQDSGGRGLGLAIAAEIAKAHGGRIELGSSRLGGASFVLSIPAAG
jgi:signal transduction histidine kinase